MDTKTKALKWWDELDTLDKDNTCKRHFPFSSFHELMDFNIEKIYLAEHPQSEIIEPEYDLAQGNSDLEDELKEDNSTEFLWRLESDNDTGQNDESYLEWYNLINPQGKSIAKITDIEDANKLLALINNHDALVKTLSEAIEKEEAKYNSNKDQADWYNNNMPGVGQTLDYQSYPPLPEWVTNARNLLNRIKQ